MVITMKSFYHKYYEGYEERRLPRRNGKGTYIEHIYEGVYYRQEHSDWMWFGLKILYFLLLVSGAALFYHAAARPLVCNGIAYVVFCQALCLLGMIWLAWVTINYMAAPRNMKIYTYKSTSLQMIKAARMLALCYGITVLAVLFAIFSGSNIQEDGCVYSIVEYLGSGVLAFILYCLEKHTPYIRQKEI